jgi:hypothetical protein
VEDGWGGNRLLTCATSSDEGYYALDRKEILHSLGLGRAGAWSWSFHLDSWAFHRESLGKYQSGGVVLWRVSDKTGS